MGHRSLCFSLLYCVVQITYEEDHLSLKKMPLVFNGWIRNRTQLDQLHVL